MFDLISKAHALFGNHIQGLMQNPSFVPLGPNEVRQPVPLLCCCRELARHLAFFACLWLTSGRTRVWELQHYNNWTPKTNDWQPSSVRPRARGARALFALLACASSCPDTRCAAERWRQLDRPQQPVRT
jgi:hypothetical protein